MKNLSQFQNEGQAIKQKEGEPPVHHSSTAKQNF